MTLQPFAHFLVSSLLFLWRPCSANKPGIVGLWSDSECNSKGATSHFGQPDPIKLHFSLEPDICGVPGATVHSYRVEQLAVCDNGTEANFSIYHRDNCTADPTDEDPDPMMVKRRIEVEERQFIDADGNSLVGSCLALVEFNSLAFVCDRVDPDMERAKVASTLRPTSTFVTGTGTATRRATGTAAETQSQVAPSQVTGGPFAAVSPLTSRSSSVQSSPMTTPVQQRSSSSSGLSTGANAGVGIGCAAGLLVVAAVAFLMFRRYRIVRRAEEKSIEASGARENVPPHLGGASQNVLPELGGASENVFTELGGASKRILPELGGGQKDKGKAPATYA
ncbi:MAG: hypothetical protein LQ351_002107 [Letrouitia transgressa]|nr:MAG: hypothetical protein LQ351_002107 [Letrouitia transgressa]